MNRVLQFAVRRNPVRLTLTSKSSYCTSDNVKNQIAEMVKKEKVFVFMKGTPDAPRCGFSNAVVQILNFHGITDYGAFDVLSNEDLRQGKFANFPWHVQPGQDINLFVRFIW